MPLNKSTTYNGPPPLFQKKFSPTYMLEVMCAIRRSFYAIYVRV